MKRMVIVFMLMVGLAGCGSNVRQQNAQNENINQMMQEERYIQENLDEKADLEDRLERGLISKEFYEESLYNSQQNP